MATEIWVNIGWGNGSFPDHTKPLPELMLTHKWCPVAITWWQFHKITHPSITKLSLKTIKISTHCGLATPGGVAELCNCWFRLFRIFFHLFGAKLLHEPMLTFVLIGHSGRNLSDYLANTACRMAAILSYPQLSSKRIFLLQGISPQQTTWLS